MSAEFLYRKEDKQPVPKLIPLTNINSLENDIKEGMKHSKGSDVGFSMTLGVFKECLQQEFYPGIRIEGISGKFATNKKNREDTLLDLAGRANIVGKKVEFGFTLENEENKVVVKNLELKGFMAKLFQPRVTQMLSELDSMAKGEINSKIKTSGTVASFKIGDNILECRIRPNLKK